MGCNNKRCDSRACSCSGVAISVIVGATFAILFASVLIPFIVISTCIAFGFGAVALIFSD